MKLPEPIAGFQWNPGWRHWEQVIPEAMRSEGVVPMYSETQVREVVNDAAQICQRWIDDHSKADNCTYNDCDMVAAVTDVMNEIKGMTK